MNGRTIIPTVLTLAGFFAMPAARAADSASQAFITDAIQGNLAEISVGQLAQQRGGSDDMKQFGQTLVADHTKANQNAVQAAGTLGVTAPTLPTDEQKTMHDSLAAQTGAAFDRAFLDDMVDSHQETIVKYQKAASDDKDAAGQYATQALPTLQMHLKMAQALVNNMRGAGENNGSSKTPPLAGANSFTEGQAKARIEKAGFTGVSDLKMDDRGIWRGTASKSGHSQSVSLDFKGNVVGE